ncbi:hypothetical protein ZWY2020_008204 [Hordeum vulgare]|nr:hypothetical protein ZWY2020_035968 [Hordeum vulgare]KAI4993891.1 hypothetical protein ZWY2020_008204 [Hordeum vulgare]
MMPIRPTTRRKAAWNHTCWEGGQRLPELMPYWGQSSLAPEVARIAAEPELVHAKSRESLHLPGTELAPARAAVPRRAGDEALASGRVGARWRHAGVSCPCRSMAYLLCPRATPRVR